jgi:hypothetical protein
MLNLFSRGDLVRLNSDRGLSAVRINQQNHDLRNKIVIVIDEYSTNSLQAGIVISEAGSKVSIDALYIDSIISPMKRNRV